jgi:hypothetical protein
MRGALTGAILRVALRRGVTAPDADAGIAALAEAARCAAAPEHWHTAVAKALHDGLLYDPVRLPAGALQCHWRLELTPAGVEAARRLPVEQIAADAAGDGACDCQQAEA